MSAPILSLTGLDSAAQRLINVADPVNPQDAATKAFATNASNLASGTIAPAILGASSLFIGTTAVALNRATAAQALTGITSIDGSAAKLTTARSISITGDGTWTTSFDGSAAATGVLTLANTGVTAGTYNSFTVDAKGRITAASVAGGSGVTIGSTAIAGGGSTLTLAGLTSVTATTHIGALTGNADTATKLATARAISTTGDATWSVSFDGTAAATAALTLANSGVTAGTYTSVTVDAKGRVTAGSSAGGGAVTLTGDATGTGTGSVAVTLANTGVTAGTYTSVTVDAKGRITGGTNPAGASVTSQNIATALGYTPAAAGTNNDITALNALVNIVGSFMTLNSSGMTLTVPINAPQFNVAGVGGAAGNGVNVFTLGNQVLATGGTYTTMTGMTAITSTLFTGVLAGNASSATAVAVTNDTATNAAMNLAWVNGSTGNLGVSTSASKLNFNPSTGALSATKFVGDGSLLTGIVGGGGGGGASISTATPQPLAIAGASGSSTQASAADHVHILPTAAQINALGLPCPWNPLTNVATLPTGGTTSLQANTAPTGDNSFFASVGGTLLVPLTAAGGGQITTVNVNDIVYYVGVSGWGKLLSSANGTTGAAILKGDNAGGLANASPGVDYAPAPNLQSGIPVGVAPMGWVGPNGFWTIPSAWAFPSGSTYTNQSNYYNTFGAWFYFWAGAISPASPSGFYFTQMGSTGVMAGTLTGGTGYTNGVYTNVALTGGAGSAALANITVAGGIVTQVVITHQGTGYAIGNTLSASTATIGAGTGFTYVVSVLNAYNTTTGVTSLTLTNGGSGYVNGTYTNVPLTGGAGVGAQATITVQGGVVVAAAMAIQGSGYAASNALSAAAANLGGSGSGLVLTVAAVGAGPMTGIIYNNTYTPGINTGAWSTSNLSLQLPATPTPFVGTQGSYYASATSSTTQRVLTAVKVPGGYPGPNGRMNLSFMQNSMSSAATKTMTGTLSTSATGAGSASIGAGTNLTTTIRQVVDAFLVNRGNLNYQIGGASTLVSAGSSTSTVAAFPTGSDFYIVTTAAIGQPPSGVYNTPGVLTGGSGYTNGTFTNAAITGGTGTGMTATITVAGGVVTSFVITNPGTGYTANNSLLAAGVLTGGTGFSYILYSGVIAGGSGYTNGTYYNVPLTGGAGSGAVANITVAGGAVVNVVATNPGTGYATSNVLTASTTYLGAGTGFTYTLAGLFCAPDWTVQEYVSIVVTPQP